MDIGQLEAFISVAELQSFSKAAKQFHLTQSAISKRISLLENYLDIALFERFGQRIQLTETGKILLISSREILDKIRDMKNHSDMSKEQISGKLRIATSHHIGLYRLPTILQSFSKKFPNVRLDMHFTDSEIAYGEVGQGLFDLAIATLPKNTNKSVKMTPLWKDELVVMSAKTHPINEHHPLLIKNLAKHSAILPDEGTFTRKIIDSVFKENNIHYQLAFTTNYLETIKVMVEAGLGWSVLPKIMLNESLTHCQLPLAQPIRILGTMIHKNKIITPALEAFLKELWTNNKNIEKENLD